MPDPKELKFTHSYTTERKMAHLDKGVFSSDFTSYIADGKEGIKDKIVGENMTRQTVMDAVRKNLLDQMHEANEESKKAALEMREQHDILRGSMVAALNKIKSVTRERDELQAEYLVEQSKRSSEKATQAAQALDALIQMHRDMAVTPEKERNDDGLPLDEKQKKAYKKKHERSEADQTEDLNKMQRMREQVEENKKIVHSKTPASFFRAIGKSITRLNIEEKIQQKNMEIIALREDLKKKARSWNLRRKNDHQNKTFRKFYDDYDRAASSYYMLNRSKDQKPMPDKEKKNIKEYVGEFDLEALDQELENVQKDLYYAADLDQVKIRNKEGSKTDRIEHFMKSHERMTLTSSEDENGVKMRYKIYNFTTVDGREVSKGYEARRQYNKDKPTMLVARNHFVKTRQLFADMKSKLAIEEKDARDHYVNTQDNVRIMQAQQNKRHGEILNGIFLNGQFISTDRKKIKGTEDSKRVDKSYIGFTEFFRTGFLINKRNRMWTLTKQEEEVRGAVLKASIFTQLNSKTIQHMMGYDASNLVSEEKIYDEIADALVDHIVKKGELKGLPKAPKVLSPDGLESFKKEIKGKLFSDAHERDVLDVKKKALGDVEEHYKKILLGKDKEKIKKVPPGLMVKIAYDVLRKEHLKAAGMNPPQEIDLLNEKTETGRLMKNISGSFAVLEKLSLLLLSNDNQPAYWNLAKTICTELRLTFFEKKAKGKFDSRFQRTIAKSRTDSGQVMRMSLIDELLADRSHLSLNDPLGALMPTRLKQYKDDLAGKRGFAARMGQEFWKGTFTRGISNVFTGVVDYVDFTESVSKDTLGIMQSVQLYTSTLSTALDIGAITEIGSYAISDSVSSSDDLKTNRGITGLVTSIVKNTAKLVKAVKECYDKKVKEAKRKEKKSRNYDPKSSLGFLDNKWYKLITDLGGVFASVGGDVMKYESKKQGISDDDKAYFKQMKAVCGVVKSSLSMLDNLARSISSGMAVSRIKNKETELKTIMSTKEDELQGEEKDIQKILKENSQLQYGLSCAKRSARNDRVAGVFGSIKNVGKTIIGIFKISTGEEVTKTGPFAIVDGLWDTVMDSIQIGTEVVRDKLAVRADIGKMIGKKYKSWNKSMISSVLQREAGIKSTDYLLDLGRIFMSINTDTFMKEADKDAEKKLGADIMRTLMNNKNFGDEEDRQSGYESLKKGHAKNLMKVMGVKGNFHGILKHSLAKNGK